LIGNRGSKSREVVVPIHPTGSKAPLYVLHGLTGEVIHYHNLRKYLRGDRPVHGLQLPEREFASLREMAQHYCEELRRCQPQGPYLLSGYSFGGNVAFEMARILTESRSEVVFVGLFEGVSPKLGWSEMRWRPALLGHWARSLPGWLREILGRPSVMGKAFWRRLNRWSRRRAHLQTPIQVEDFADEHQSKVQRLVGLSRNHTPEPYPGRVHLFRTGALGFHHVDPEMGWGRRARGGVSIHHVLGTHEDMLYEPQVASLAQELQRALDDLPC
jgi:aspartate racemase